MIVDPKQLNEMIQTLSQLYADLYKKELEFQKQLAKFILEVYSHKTVKIDNDQIVFDTDDGVKLSNETQRKAVIDLWKSNHPLYKEIREMKSKVKTLEMQRDLLMKLLDSKEELC